MSVVTCPAPGGPVTFSHQRTCYVMYAAGAHLALPEPAAPGTTRGPSPGRSRGRRAANRRDSERISAQNYTT
jgi:hypothetical protein